MRRLTLLYNKLIRVVRWEKGQKSITTQTTTVLTNDKAMRSKFVQTQLKETYKPQDPKKLKKRSQGKVRKK